MIAVRKNEFIETKFVFVSESQIYDPTAGATPIDTLFFIIRGETTSGAVVDGPFSYFREIVDTGENVQISKTGTGQFTFRYRVPASFQEGTYSIFAKTIDEFGEISISSPFQVVNAATVLSPIVISPNTSTTIAYQPTYDDINRSLTNTVCLIGHADNIELNNPFKIRSIQSAIDLLGADMRSPLLRGVFDAYAAGARDIFIMAAAPLGEYTSDYRDRLVSSTIYELDAATPSPKTFYQKYYERLQETYSVLQEIDFIDYIVPLETSIIKTGGVDFVTQLALHLADFHETTGFVQLGIIGSRSGGITSTDLNDFRSSSLFANKLTQYNGQGEITSDIGRYVIPIYGEAVFSHEQLKTSYTSQLAASYAGMLAALPLNMALIRSRLPGVMSVFGNDLTTAEIQELEGLGINTIYRGRRTRRSTPFEVYATNEYTMAASDSVLSKATQMRIVAALISRVKFIADDAIGRLGYERAVDTVRDLLEDMKDLGIVIDFSLKVEVDPFQRGKLIFYIELLSSLGLKKIDFAIAAGPEA